MADKRDRERTHPEDGGVVLHTMPRLRLIHSEVLHFSSTEDDVGVGLLHRRDELLRRPKNTGASTRQHSSLDGMKETFGEKRKGSEGRQRKDPHGVLRSRIASVSS